MLGNSHGSRTGKVQTEKRIADTSVCYVRMLSIWRECEAFAALSVTTQAAFYKRPGGQPTIWGNESVSDNSQGSSLWIEAIHLIRQSRLRTKILPVAVHGVREVYIAITRIDRYVVN